MQDDPVPVSRSTRMLIGFFAGAIATVMFHQVLLALLWRAGIAPFPPFQVTATAPFGVPAIVSLSFWGGVWGILFAAVDHRFWREAGYWVAAALFGALLPTAIALLVVLPLKGRPIGGGWHFPLLLTAVLVNGAWGLGTGWILRYVTAEDAHA